MDFGDIVDMDWLNSHTIDSTCLPSPPLLKEEQDVNMDLISSSQSTTATDMSIFNQDAVVIPDTSIINPITTTTTAATTTTTMTKDMLIMPSTEQIKQLIELAKKHLALREQLSVKLPTSKPLSEPEQLPLSPSSQSASTILFPTLNNSTIASNIPDTVSPESLIKSEETTGDTTMNNSILLANNKSKRGSLSSFHNEEGAVMSLEAYAELDGIDIKKLTSKERRQLRNKISARNFRVRRKEYITALEGQVKDHKKANEQLLHKLNIVEEENKQLKLQIDSLKRQNMQLSNNISENKNLSNILSPSTVNTDTYRQDSSILVS
ncbi:uncharacterized protein BX663DRAFT_540753 [Cokeromyces recurvatus]|uniref:uncharacterized protein n=1 Tax=Cokeromyces recurvatus TaxID=90255 RepID=UPI00221FA4AD|nr:uncharacterized protein BX663DRAFT_540753 [Cokeromyces recurvatus]KAI7906131.1 hypothetical protein BX663DRAFT_540753 [Cokeromyces recurvatus]